ncbi:hypothetical protein COV24_00375 [candidate division WWE3 bacterium CG10_big_fil_rev_8_21_14_0_10_32_10]|uniref:F0F1 ATP synthase subunit alpha n=1 Tax=candidate division WWE3 bacterium CG10_big_fil_rev_8_21_14_0_10_32_10 TaxID=1975090 RepID=A0A2H0RBN5_UNCKA|nr:MAG: hypothetical protein COV24_00375 [candidate division WWE3 bacterium CG10_big_fil_rev_8_21_14_0_10_32_10]
MSDFKDLLEKTGEYGIVEEVRHPVVYSSGLPGARVNEVVMFETGEEGKILSLEEDRVEIMVFTRTPVSTGVKLVRKGYGLAMPVGEEYLGCVINPLGDLLFSKKDFVKPEDYKDLDQEPLKIDKRARITKQLGTGIVSVDMLLPIGKGQRELIVGDRKTGKTSIFITMIKKQIEENEIIIYAAIGKRKVEIKKLKEYFENAGLLKNIAIVATSSEDSPSLIDLTPYAAMTLAEFFRDKGINTVVIFDDLTNHAKFYRELSLIAKRFPGRDSYPGDIFHKHAKLLERGGNYITADNKQVSVTCFPVAETTQGNLTDYIVSNLISITDGHILFDMESFNKGMRPAVNIFLSVTRVGKQTQDILSREINRRVMAFLIKYEQAQRYSHFGSELSGNIKKTLSVGDKIYKFFEQNYDNVVPIAIQKIGIGMIWTDIFETVKDSELILMRNSLIKKYKTQKKVETFANSIVDTNSFAKLLDNIRSNEKGLLDLCDIKTVSKGESK